MRTSSRVPIVPASWLPFAVLSAGLALIFFAYTLALPGIFLFDEAPNLQRLELIKDWQSGFDFIFSGDAGPLGRPLALATFVAQAEAWPDDPGAMLVVNISIHLLACIAVFFLALGLARIRLKNYSDTQLVWIATGASLLWGLSPFLATTNLMIIQRMASLAGFFVFTGLAAFVWAHLIIKENEIAGRILLISGLSFGTVLAALAKENGLLLPLLALIILWFWIPKSERINCRTGKFIIFFLAILPAFILCCYLANLSIQIFTAGYGPHRQFTPYERVLSQVWILLDYLWNLIIPRAINVSPFTDGVRPSTGWLTPAITIISLAVWTIFFILSLTFRKRMPWFLFGLIFFLVSHLIESTTIGLELYFAHRNYIGAFGIYFALVLFAFNLSNYKKLAKSGLAAYAGVFFIVLIQSTYQWSHIGVTSELWAIQNPNSIRAAQFLATQYLLVGDKNTAQEILVNASHKNPTSALLAIQRTLICGDETKNQKELFSELKSRLLSIPLDFSAVSELVNISQKNPSVFCSTLTFSDISDLADSLLKNPVYFQSSYAKSHLLIAKGFAAAEQNKLSEAAEFFINAFRAYPHLDSAFTASSLLSNQGDHTRALSLLEEARALAPQNPIQRLMWLQRLDSFVYLIEKSRLIDNS